MLPAGFCRAAGIAEGRAVAVAYLGNMVIYQLKVVKKEIEEVVWESWGIVLEVREVDEECGEEAWPMMQW